MSIFRTLFVLDGTLPKGFSSQGAPWVYQGSAIAPTTDGARGGRLEFSVVAEGIPRLPLDAHLKWARLGIENSTGGAATVVLSREQASALRDAITRWLDPGVAEEDDELAEP